MLRYRERGKALSPDEPWLSRVLRNRGADSPQAAQAFLHPSIDNLIDPMRFPDMEKAVTLIRQAMADQGLICVYGDYDVDGICATSILLLLLRKLQANVRYYIPLRDDGYGMNVQAMRKLAAEGVRLLISVDCGITSVEEVRVARELGITVIITDHHEPGEMLPRADALLNPKLGYPFPHLCGAGVAFKLAWGLAGKEEALELMDLAAIATVADMVSLIGENRIITRLGLERTAHTRRDGLRMLMLLAQTSAPLTAQDVGYRVGPRLNAGGRLQNAAQCVELLTSSGQEAEELARHLHALNDQRRAQQEIIKHAADQQVAQWDFCRHRVLLIQGRDWNKGVVGLAAGRLVEQWNYPTIVLSASDKGESVGSCRSIEGINIHAVLTECGRRWRAFNGSELYVRFGGHEMAAGLTILTDRVPEFLRLLDMVLSEERFCPDRECYIPSREYDAAVPLGQVSMDMVDMLKDIQPTGKGNPPPVFLGQGQVETMRSVGRDGTVLQLSLIDEEAGRAVKGVYFGGGHLSREPWNRVSALFEPSRNEYMGRVSLQLQVKSLIPARDGQTLPAEKALFEHLMQEIMTLSQNKYNFRDAPERLKDAPLRRLLQDSAGRGVLLLADSVSGIRQWLNDRVDLCCEAVRDPRAFNSLVYRCDMERLQDWWHTIVLLDGDILPGRVARLRELCPAARILALEPDPGMLADLKAMAALDRESIGRLYLALRKGVAPSVEALTGATELSLPQLLCAAAALHQAGLIRYRPSPTVPQLSLSMLPPPTGRLPQDRSPVNSPVMKYLQERPERSEQRDLPLSEQAVP